MNYGRVQQDDASTVGIDLALESLDGSTSYQLATGFRGGDLDGNIVGHFAAPAGACGDFRLV